MNVQYIHDEAEARERVSPMIFHPRWYALNQLKKAILYSISKIVQSKGTLTLLDVGCGSMPYKPLIGHYFKDYSGADISLNENIDYLINRDGRIDVEDEQFDVVISTQVMEHVEDPKVYLNEIFRVLKEGGNAIISTHGTWMFHPDPTDYWRWTRMGLEKVVREAGFEVLEVRALLNRASTGMQLLQDGLIFKLPQRLRWIFIPYFQILIKLLDNIGSKKSKIWDAAIYVLILKK